MSQGIEIDGDGLTREIVEGVVSDILENKLPRKYAATKNGCTPTTLQRYIDMGDMGDGGPLHYELAKRVHQAEGTVIGQVMSNQHLLSASEPKAADVFLKAFKPGDFGGPKPEPDEFDRLERQQRRRNNLWQNTPPRMLAEATAQGWWKFPKDISDEDRAILAAMQQKYRTLALPEKAHV